MFTVKNLLMLIGRNLLITLAIVSITIISIFFFSKEMTRISDTVALNHKLEKELKQRTELLGILEKETQVVGTNDQKIENAFIPSDNILAFINALDALALKENIKQAYHFGTPTASSVSAPFPIATISYGNSITSNISGIINYLKEFEKLPYFTKIDNIAITSQDKAGWSAQSTTSMQAILYTKSIQ